VPRPLRPDERDDKHGANQVGANEDGLTGEAIDHDASDGTEQQDREDLGGDEQGDGGPLAGQQVPTTS
jgi:hypothetical protein